MTESHADPPQDPRDAVEVAIKIGDAFRIILLLDAGEQTGFTLDVQRLVQEYGQAVTFPPTPLPQLQPRPRTPANRTRPKGDAAIMRTRLLELIDAGVLARRVEDQLSKRGGQSDEIKALFWALVDISKIETTIERPDAFPVISQQEAEQRIRFYANLASVD